MKSKYLKSLIAVCLATLISNVPYVAAAEVVDRMVPTTELVEQLSREQAVQNIRDHLNRAEVREQLEKLGLKNDEISNRMASLSDSELRQMAQQMDQAQYGGDIAGVLIIVVLVLLIIYLAKRI